MDKRKLLGRFYARGLEETGFALETFRVPGFRKQHRAVVKTFYREANRVRRMVGLKPKTYKTWNKRKLREIRGV